MLLTGLACANSLSWTEFQAAAVCRRLKTWSLSVDAASSLAATVTSLTCFVAEITGTTTCFVRAAVPLNWAVATNASSVDTIAVLGRYWLSQVLVTLLTRGF